MYRSGKINQKYKLSKHLNNPEYKKYFKIIPIVCLLLILKINSSNSFDEVKNQSFIEQINTFVFEFKNSFDFSDTTLIITTVLILITIWTGYKYWLRNYRIIRRNKKITEQILFAVSIVVLSEHIIYNSVIGQIFDYIIFFVFLYVVLASTWLLAKILDSLNMENDLYCWGLRLIGIVLMFFGFVMFSSGAFVMALNTSTSSNIFWISGICLMLLGAFSEYRSFRRHGIFVYVR